MSGKCEMGTKLPDDGPCPRCGARSDQNCGPWVTSITKRAEAAEARCKRLAEAGEELADLMDAIVDGEYTPDSFTSQPIRAALSDTAQQDHKARNVSWLKAIDESRMLGRGEGKADMRERAAMLAEDKAESMGGISDIARHIEHIGKRIRALPLDTAQTKKPPPS